MQTEVAPNIKNDLLLQAAKGSPTKRPPVWLMRQAGRILPEYRKVRAKAGSFKNLVTNPELTAEVTLQPVDILGVDAAIIFSDILVIPEALGLPYEMVEKKGPFFPKTITSAADIEALKDIDPYTDIHYTIQGIKIVKEQLSGRVPLIGFAGAPFTIFAYMIEGSGSKTFSKARGFLYRYPELSKQLLQKITDATILYLNAQISAGANLVQVFDSWASILPEKQYKEFGLKYIHQICSSISKVPVTVFAKGVTHGFDLLADLPCETLGIDWNMNRSYAIEKAKNKTLQGNLDPCVLYADDQTIVGETLKMLDDFSDVPYIANLGHGVYPDTDPDKVKLFVETVKTYSHENK